MKYTVETKLNKKQNKELLQYFDDVVKQYNYVFRVVWHIIKNNPKIKRHVLNSYLQYKFNITKRTAATIISCVLARLNSIIMLKKHELKQIEYKMEKLEQKINVLQEQLNKEKENARNNNIENLLSYNNLKEKVTWVKIHRDKLKNKIVSLYNQIEANKFKLTFGTNSLLKQDIDKFLKKRDNQMCFLGSREELCCNQNFQLVYDKEINQFHIKIRKDFNENKQLKGNDRYVYGKCHFNYMKKNIVEILKTKSSPLTYRIIKKGNNYYLQCILSIDENVVTRNNNGVIGIDFNKGFLAISETNHHGNLVKIDKMNYRFKQGNKTKNDLLQCISEIVKQALQVGKDVVIEDLNFSKKKSETLKTTSSKGKKYNDMLHSLAYRIFTDGMEHSCNKNGVGLVKVNPAWTSWIAKHKYCSKMKLNIHAGASFVIARRGMNFKEGNVKEKYKI